MKWTLLYIALPMTFVVASAHAKDCPNANRAAVQRALAEAFGTAVDGTPALFEVNRYYALMVTFDEQGCLDELSVEPKHWHDAEHPEWKETAEFHELTEAEYEALLARLERVQAKGALVKRATGGVVTNATAHLYARYVSAIVEIGEVVDLCRGESEPRAIKFFRIRFHDTP